MFCINATNLRKNLFTYLERTIKYDEPIRVSTKEGAAIIISEERYNGLMTTLQLLSTPGMADKLSQGKNTSLEECLSEEEVDW